MDRATQRYIIGLILFLITSLLQAQNCNETFVRVTNDTLHTNREVHICKIVEMSPDKFAYYYQIEKNLQAIEDSIPVLAKNIEKERATSDSIKVSLERTVELTNLQKDLLKIGLQDCIETATELEIKNLYLNKALVRQRKITWVKGGAGLVLGILIKGLL